MKDYTNLYSDILFYTKEYERLQKELKNILNSNLVKQKLERECTKVKAKLDALSEKIPEISENL